MILAGRIKDPIHGYIPFTTIERPFLDHPLTQRLRHVAQSGLAHMVFPEVRTSRFAHSLGAMHLASRFWSSALRSTESDLRAALEIALKDAVDEATNGYFPNNFDEMSDQVIAEGLLSGSHVSGEFRNYALLVEQGLRLAALFHDLGHLPFSHDFEYALGQVLDAHPELAKDRLRALSSEPDSDDQLGAIHERIGYRAARALFRKLNADSFGGSDMSGYARACVDVAEKILLSEAPETVELAITEDNRIGSDSVWWLLHGLMAGELDVDRCDYLLRDARAYGFEFASYDLNRLVDNLTIVRPRADRALLSLGVLAQGVSPAESFLIARYRSYQWGPFHHKVAQFGAALQHCIREILEQAVANPTYEPELNAFLDALQTIAGASPVNVPADALEAFVEYDDVWWLRVMRKRLAANPGDPWLGLVCRRGRGPRSLWKRPDQFPGGLESLRAFNNALSAADDLAALVRWNAAVEKERPQVLVSRHGFKPWSAVERSSHLWVRSQSGNLISLTELSYLTASLRDAWDRDVQVHAFSRDPSGDPDKVIQDLRAALKKPSGQGAL